MNLNDQLLAALSSYGLPVLFSVLTVAAVGAPVPATLMLLVAGSLVAQGEMSLWSVLLLSSAGAILGDQIGYGIGRWGGRRLLRRLSGWLGEERLKRAEETTRRWGGWGVFLSRWLITPLGPAINLTSGITDYHWPRFLIFDALGETLWVALYVMLGKIFSDSVIELSDLLGDLTWVIVGLIAALLLGWKLFQSVRPVHPDRAPQTEPEAAVFDSTS